MNRLSRTALATTLAATVLAVASATAAADTVVMGSTLSNTFDGGLSSGPTLSTQLRFDPSTSPNPVVSPADGVITGWKVRSADDGAIYTLKVLRPNGPVSLVVATNTNFTAIRSVQAPTAVPAGTSVSTPTGVIFDYPASLPISKGDYIGVLTGGADDDVPQHTTNGLAQNLIANNFSGLPADGTSANLLADEQHDLLLQATVKFCKVPNLAKLKQAAAQQALAAADCAAGKVTKKKLKPSKKSKKKKGKVLGQSLAPGTTGAPGTTVDLKIGALGKKKKR
jgi:PASTA domain